MDRTPADRQRYNDAMSRVTELDDTGWQDSLWAATATDAPATPALEEQTECDVVVVGAGYTGLSAALHLAEAGKSVLVLDSFGPGWGCSGRNGGQVNPAWKVLPDVLEKRMGQESAARAMRMAGDACDLVFDLVERFAIDCEAIRPGYVQGGYGQHGKDFIAQWVLQWQRRGVEVSMLDHDEISTMLGTSVYSFGMYDARGGSVQPLSYVRGLARAALAAGARVHGLSPVIDARRTDGSWVALTASGASVRARHLLWCTNGYTDGVIPGLRESVVPVTSFIAASSPLSAAARSTVLPGGHAVSETARIQVYYRLDGRGRMVFGGRGDALNTRLNGSTTHLERQALAMFPELEGVRWEYRWGGHPAMTTDSLPRLMRIGDNAFSALGYNGRGVAMGTMMGRELSHAVLSGETALPVTGLRKTPLHGLRQLGIAWHIFSGRLLDALDGRKA